MYKTIFQLYSLLFYFLYSQFCNCDILSKESTCFNLIANVEASLTTTLEFVKLVKEAHSSESCAGNKEDKDSSFTTINSISHLLSSNCAELYLQGHRKSGVYDVFPKERTNPSPFQVYCDMENDGGGWTMIQRRDDFGEPRENFFRKWDDYKKGFGDLNKEFWLGNDHISMLTLQDRMTLLINLEDFENTSRSAEFSEFRVEGETDNYRMNYLKCSGNAGNSLIEARGKVFSTVDRDQYGCSSKYYGAWWYQESPACFRSNLNGVYIAASVENYTCPSWYSFNRSYRCLKRVEMKLRPDSFAAT